MIHTGGLMCTSDGAGKLGAWMTRPVFAEVQRCREKNSKTVCQVIQKVLDGKTAKFYQETAIPLVWLRHRIIHKAFDVLSESLLPR